MTENIFIGSPVENVVLIAGIPWNSVVDILIPTLSFIFWNAFVFCDHLSAESWENSDKRVIPLFENEKQKLKDTLLPDYWDKIKEKQNKFNPNFGKLMDIYAQKVEEWDSSGVSLYNDPFDN